MATVLGVGDNSGSDTLTVTLTAAQPANSFVHVIHAAALENQPFFTTPRVAALPSDSQGGTWQDATFAPHVAPFPPIIGSIQDGNGGGAGSRTSLQLGQTGERTAGTSLGIGDTVTVTWDDRGVGAAGMLIIAIVVAFTEYTDVAVSQYINGTVPGDFVGVFFANGLNGADMSPFDGHSLSWATSGGVTPYPHDAAAMLAAAATYPATSGYTPSVGSETTEHSSADGKLTLAISLANAPALTAIEPGGSFSGSHVSIMVGNYQFAVGSVVPPPTKKCRDCGGMLGGMATRGFSKWL